MKHAVPDYDADDVLVVAETDRLRALADDFRLKIVMHLREHAASTSELAEAFAVPKGTVGHHLKVLARAGLVRVVRTRKVRGVTEKYYGRTARLFVIKGAEGPVEGLAAETLRMAADEVGINIDPERSTVSFIHTRLSRRDALRFRRRLEKLVDDIDRARTLDGTEFGIAVALYPLDRGRG